MPAYLPKELTPVTELTTSAATLYTAPASTTALVKQIVIANVSGLDARATLHIVPSGGSVAAENKIFGEVLIPANTTQLIDGSMIVPTGATIRGLANIADAINVHVSGVEID
jgi:hypothetical protein